jgi:putative transposase
MTKRSPFRYFKTSPEIIRLAVMMYVRFPLSLRNVEDLLHERGIDVCHETVRFWWNRFGPLFAAEIRKKRVSKMRAYSNWQWHLDEVFVKINGEQHYLWRAVDHEGEILESFVTKARDKKAALKFLKKAMRKHGSPDMIVTDLLRSYGAALKEIGAADRQETGRWLNNRVENSHLPFRRREGPCCGSAACEVCRNSPPSTLQFTIIFIRNAAFQRDQISSSTALPFWLSGVVLAQHKGQFHCLFGDAFELV